MLRSLYTAATGMEAQQTQMDVIANNLANASTTGFKRERAEFSDLLSDTTHASGAPEAWMVSESRSENSARSRLKPVVEALARLLAMTSICVCCASIPVA